MASILHTTGSTDAGPPHSSADQPCFLISNENQPDDGPLAATGVDISPPAAFSDTTKRQTTSEQTELTQKSECLPSHGLSLVASLRQAASEQEKEREQEREIREKERIENMKREERERADREERDRKEREEAERKDKERVEKEKEERQRLEKERDERMERERMESEKEEESKRLEKEGKELRNKQREEKEEAETENEQHIERADGEEKKENEERERKMERDKKRKGEEERMQQRLESSKGEKSQQKQIISGSTSLQHKHKVMYSQSNDWPPLREAELDDIAYDERLQVDEESKSDLKLVTTVDSKTEGKLVSPRPADSAPTATPTKKLNSRSVKPEDSVIAVKKAPDNPALRSIKKDKFNLKSGAIPVQLTEEEDEEVEYERGQEDLGSIWLAELYMEGEAG